MGPKMLVICNTETTAINISATDKLTSILLDAFRRFENFQNAVITRRLPKIVPIVTQKVCAVTKVGTVLKGEVSWGFDIFC